MKNRLWWKGMLITITIGGLAQFAGWGEGCVNTAIQRILISTAFD